MEEKEKRSLRRGLRPFLGIGVSAIAFVIAGQGYIAARDYAAQEWHEFEVATVNRAVKNKLKGVPVTMDEKGRVEIADDLDREDLARAFYVCVQDKDAVVMKVARAQTLLETGID